MCVRPALRLPGLSLHRRSGRRLRRQIHFAGDSSCSRFANRIPLLYDEANDVAFRIIKEEIDWKRYKIPTGRAACDNYSRLLDKDSLQDRGKGVSCRSARTGKGTKERRQRSPAETGGVHVSRKGSMEFQKKRMNIYGRYLPLIAKFSTESFGKEESLRITRNCSETK